MSIEPLINQIEEHAAKCNKTVSELLEWISRSYRDENILPWEDNNMIKPIEKNAGYTIVQYEEYNPEEHNFIVLGHNEKTGMWVTWFCHGEDNFAFGHYFTSGISARQDYHERLAERYAG